MSSVSAQAKNIFLHAVENHEPKEWPEYLRTACQGDAKLRRQVEALLSAYRAPNPMLDGDGIAATLAPASENGVGHQIGPYKLREKIGEGGMGEVYVAEQTEPVRRKVALKIIKPGMASRDVVARFEAERQALAMMDHPNIARVLDGGATEAGQPFFVMELVRGVPITEYCDRERLSTTARLQLFIKVCRAVQHAHQKGIIHRDIKPTNVLVPEIDGEAVPRVIDFGVAKAVSQKLADQTVYTQFEQVVGTPLYMSPEQAGTGVVDIDTRSDVYSLGVLLYELLTGNTPFDRETLKQSGFDEFRRILREQEPRRPSQAISTLNAEAMSTISDRRACDPRRLVQTVRGELDWIVMKALEKDRARRYETANGLARDIERYLDSEPVEACPPSLRYRLRKYAKRNTRILTTGVMIGLALLLATSVSVWYALKANQALAVAEQERSQSRADYRRAVEAIDLMIEHVASDEFDTVPGMTDVREDLFQSALDFYEQVASEHPAERLGRVRQARALSKLQYVYQFNDQPRRAIAAGDKSIRIAKELSKKFPDDLEVMLNVGQVYLKYFTNRTIPEEERQGFLEASMKIFAALVKSDNKHIADQARTELGHSYVVQARILPHQDVEQKRSLLQKALEYTQGVGMERVLALLMKGRLEQSWGEHEQAHIAAEKAVAAARAWTASVYEKETATHNGRYSRQLLHVALILEADVLDSLHKKQAADNARAEALKIAHQLNQEYPEQHTFQRWILNEKVSTPEQFRQFFEDRIAQVRFNTVLDLVQLDRNRSMIELVIQLHLQGQEDYAKSLFEDLVKANEVVSGEGTDLDSIHQQLAKSLRERPDPITELNRATEVFPDVAAYYRHRAAEYREQGELEKSLADLNRSIELLGDEDPDVYRSRAYIYLSMNRIDEAEADYDRYVALEPEPDCYSWISHRAQFFAERAQWEKLHHELEEALELKPELHYLHYQLALAALGCSEGQDYRQVCRRMLKRYGETQIFLEAHFTAWTCALAPNALDDYQAAIDLARHAVEKDPGNQQGLNALGAILLRAGKYEDAKDPLAKAVEAADNNNTSRCYGYYLLAMTEHHLGNTEAAQEQLQTANNSARKELADSPLWNRRLTLNLLRKEAEALIEPESTTERKPE